MHVVLCYNKKPSINPPLLNDVRNKEPSTYNYNIEKYAEFDDAHTIKAIAKALRKLHNVSLIDADEKAYSILYELKPDIVFNIAEGLRGPYREAFIPSILEFLNIPYTGSGPHTLLICLDKFLTKQVLQYHDIPTPKFHLVSSIDEIPLALKTWGDYPCIVKPKHEGSSIGIRNNSVVNGPHKLSNILEKVISHYEQPAIVERLLSGREFTVGILGNGHNAEMLPLVELSFEELPEIANPIYSYEAKWIWDTPNRPLDIFKCPAKVDNDLFNKIRRIALNTYKVLGCRDWARIDIRLDERNIPNILEVNPLPGILPNPEQNSCMPKAAKEAGLDYDNLILSVINIACERYGIKSLGNRIPLIQRQTMSG